MSNTNKMKRISVGLSDEVYKQVEYWAGQYGMTLSSFCQYMIGQGISNHNTAQALMKDLAIKELENERIDK